MPDEQFIVKVGEKWLLNPSPIGASAGPKTFTLWQEQAKPFTKAQAHIEAGKLQRQGFRTCVIPAQEAK